MYLAERNSVPASLPMLPNHHPQHYDSDGDEDVVDVEGFDKEGHHKHLAKIQPYLNLAIGAYKDDPMHKQFPFVKRSWLIRNLENPAKLRIGPLTTDTEVHVCVLDNGTLVFAFRGTERKDWKSLLSDVLTDLRQSQVPLEHYNASKNVAYRAPSSVKVHEGFMLAFQDVTRTARYSYCHRKCHLARSRLSYSVLAFALQLSYLIMYGPMMYIAGATRTYAL